ncbi:MAG: carbamate kinase [Spirochaetes bacterium]|nr:carbamate kinase [Spirochaetota bacterium]
MKKKRIQIFAFGGNEVAPMGLHDKHGHAVAATIPMQWQRTNKTSKIIAGIIKKNPDDLYIITHGNGPQVGNILLRAEHSLDILPPLPLDVCVADSQGAMGYMIAQLLASELAIYNIKKDVASIITQVVIHKDDPDFRNPSKFIGPSFTQDEALDRRENKGWYVKMYRKDDTGKEIWRRVVPSPEPVNIIETDFIISSMEKAIVVAVGGGGIPVFEVDPDRSGVYHCDYGIKFKHKKKVKLVSGIECVVDKDLASALLGKLIIEHYKKKKEKVDVFLSIFTSEDGAKLNYQKKDQKDLRHMTVKEAEEYHKQGYFPAGSMGPKIKAIINFLKAGGKRAYISLTDKYQETLEGKAGTTVSL